MAAAAWTKGATDITGDRDRWDDYLSVKQLSDRIGLGEVTIMDTLTRNPRQDDPRSAIAQPAARIGQTRVAAIPLWTPQQAQDYLTLYAARGTGDATRADLPVYTLVRAAELGLASTDELHRLTGKAENSLRRWAREATDFPPELGQAERTPPFQFGPPRVLRSIADVCDWILRNARLEPGEAEKLTQARDDAVASATATT
jgi:hypothetical protein